MTVSFTPSALMILVISTVLAACNQQTGGYIPASLISKNGFAKNGDKMRKAHGREIRIWGFVDHANLYGDDGAKKILGEWWSGYGPSATLWSFNLKAKDNDAVGHSFTVHVPNDSRRDGLLKEFLADAKAHRPTKVFVKGKNFTFDAPTNANFLTGLYMELQSSNSILLDSQRRIEK